MKPTFLLSLFFGLSISTFCQDRQKALSDFDALKSKAAAIERLVLAVGVDDLSVASKQDANATRLMPRETYDNSFSSIPGGGAFYSFFFRYPDYGHGSELALEQGTLSTGFTDFAMMADLGEVPLSDISLDSKGVLELSNYKLPGEARNSPDFQKVRSGGLKIGETLYTVSVKPIVGHSYALRSINTGYYDILVAFSVLRQDSDKSLVLLWKLVDQFNTPKRSVDAKTTSDDQIRERTKSWLRQEHFRDIQLEVNEGIITLRGSVDHKSLAYAVQLANESALRVINLLEIK